MLAPGARVGPYEVVSAIGAGGMGEVYRARDGKLGRDVAIKVLPDIFVGDPDRVARFEREAQVVASLNHPNIAVIHGFQESDGVRALVLELVEGETLGEIIARGPVPLADALAIARQIADALEAAHDKGIVHRDLKPDNVKVTPEGKIKVLDFGLAKMLEPEPARHPSFAGTMSPTLSIHATYGGVILGTAAYMSPEQARGKPVDRRTDIWSFGCVLFEMLTGRQTFEAGETISDAVAHILTREPDWNALPAKTPPHVRTLLRRCLQKDPSKRLPHIGLVRLEIDDGPAASDELAPAAASSAPQPASKKRVAIALGVLFAAVAAGVVATWALMRTPPAVPPQLRFSVIPSSTQPFSVNGFFRNVTISPDGRHVVYVATGTGNPQLIVRALDQLEAVPLRGVTGAVSPFMSPDGQWIGFFAQLAGGDLKKASITGGPALTLCRYQGTPRGATWGTDDSIVFATNDLSTGLLRVPAAGGEPKVLTKPDPANGEQDHVFPSMLPGSRAVLFTIAPADGITDNSQVAVLDLTTGQRKILIRGGSHAQYVDPGYVVYAVAGSLRAVRFDLDRLAVSSDPVPVVDQVMTFGTGAGLFEVSRSGTLVYVPGGATSGTGTPRSLVWVDRHGQEEAIPAPTRTYVFPRLSPDGQRVAVDIRDQENDIWIFDLKRPTLTKLTFNPGPDSWPIWTPDGRRIVFGSTRGVGAQQNLFWQPADGTGTAERLTTSANIQQPHSFSPDGRSLVVYELVPSSFSDLTLLPIGSLSEKPPTGKLETQPLVYTAAAENAGEISPDGHFVAYHSNESGQPQVYVRPFPDVDKGRWQISTTGGTRPAWGPDRRELFYMNPDGAMMAVPVQTTPTFSAGNPTKLFEGQWFRGQSGRTYDVAKDGRFLMIKDAVTNDQGSAVTMTVVVNWVEELKQKLPK
jgi:eukaryotic-like serine/threonine-protein kinase